MWQVCQQCPTDFSCSLCCLAPLGGKHLASTKGWRVQIEQHFTNYFALITGGAGRGGAYISCRCFSTSGPSRFLQARITAGERDGHSFDLGNFSNILDTISGNFFPPKTHSMMIRTPASPARHYCRSTQGILATLDHAATQAAPAIERSNPPRKSSHPYSAAGIGTEKRGKMYERTGGT